jgi:RND family efflux transporter MFP subunit
MHRIPLWMAAITFLALGVGTGWLGASRTAASGTQSQPGSWQTAAVEPHDIGATVLATGVIRARVGAQVAVGSRASGIVKKLHVTVGDRVRADQLLAELDRVEFETQVHRAEAMHANAAAERAYAAGEFDRIRQLAEQDAATAAELSAANRALETARAREREAAALVEAARVQRGYTSIRAPISGVVASVSTQEGETVAASFAAPTFVTIVDLSRLEVWAYVDETDIGRVRPGQRVRFTVDTYPDETFAGQVTAIRPTAEIRDNVVNYVTLIEFVNKPDRLLRPEMTTTVNIELEGRAAALALPNGALRRDAQGTYVLLPGTQGLERRNVQVGFRGSDYSELLSGLQTGERVVLGPAQCEPAADSEKERT